MCLRSPRCHVCSVVCGLSACQRCSFRSNVIVSVFCSCYICSNASQCRAQHDICTLDIHWICSELVATCPRDQSPTSRMRYASPAMTQIRQRRSEIGREMTVLRRELRQHVDHMIVDSVLTDRVLSSSRGIHTCMCRRTVVSSCRTLAHRVCKLTHTCGSVSGGTEAQASDEKGQPVRVEGSAENRRNQRPGDVC